jgi:hypothetical protein
MVFLDGIHSRKQSQLDRISIQSILLLNTNPYHTLLGSPFSCLGICSSLDIWCKNLPRIMSSIPLGKLMGIERILRHIRNQQCKEHKQLRSERINQQNILIEL